MPDPSENAPYPVAEQRTWKTAILLQQRDDILAAIARLRRGGVDPTPLPAIVVLLEHELSRREIATGHGLLQVQAEVAELSA